MMELTNALKNPIEGIISTLDKTNYPRFKFDTSFTYSNLIDVDNSTTFRLERKDILGELEAAYEFSNGEEIRNFIMENDYLLDILKEAPKHIYEIFGKSINLCLELSNDPEEDYEELFIVVKSSYSPKKAIELEEKFLDEWFVHIMDKVNNKLSFAEEPL